MKKYPEGQNFHAVAGWKSEAGPVAGRNAEKA
jgi:hypothetical protein